MERLTAPLVLSVVAAIVTYGIAVAWGGSADTLDVLLGVDALTWIAILSLSLANYVIRFIRWEYYLNATTAARVPWFDHLMIYLGGFSLTTTPGKAGEALRSLYLLPRGIGYRESIAALFTERLVDVLSILLLSLLIFTWYQSTETWVIVTVAAAAIVMIVPIIRADKTWVVSRSLATRLPDRMSRAASSIIDTFELAGRLVKGRPLPIGLVAGVIAWGAEGFGLYLVLNAMGAGIDPAPAIAVYSIALLAGALSFLPGGLGSTEAMMILLLSALGADSATAVAATLVCRIVTLWFAVGLGAIAVGVLAARGFLPRLNAEETS